MPIETFDQRFKRLTSDMLMIDICRLLGIEIRQLMKIRSGVRVELSMGSLRKLCLEQGLDFTSFVRGYADPWSSELEQSEVITSEESLEEAPETFASSPHELAKATKRDNSLFRPDGSRIAAPPAPASAPKRPTPVETVRSSGRPEEDKPSAVPPSAAKPEVTKAPLPKKLQVSFRPAKAAPAPTVPAKYEPEPEDDFDEYEDEAPRPSIASRLREAVTSAFRRDRAENDQAELYSGVAPARTITVSGSSGDSLYPAPARQAAAPSQEIQKLISEVSDLRSEIRHLSLTVHALTVSSGQKNVQSEFLSKT